MEAFVSVLPGEGIELRLESRLDIVPFESKEDGVGPG